MATSAACAITRCSCSTSLAMRNGVLYGRATSTAPDWATTAKSEARANQMVSICDARAEDFKKVYPLFLEFNNPYVTKEHWRQLFVDHSGCQDGASATSCSTAKTRSASWAPPSASGRSAARSFDSAICRTG